MLFTVKHLLALGLMCLVLSGCAVDAVLTMATGAKGLVSSDSRPVSHLVCTDHVTDPSKDCRAE
jgi:hypothetical protein